MATYQIINLQTGEFQTLSLEEAAAIASLDPHEIEWAIEEHGVCETDTFQITKLPEAPDMADEVGQSGEAEQAEERDASDGGGAAADNCASSVIPVFVYISQEEFEAHLAERPASVIRLGWDEPIVREAVEVDKGRIMAELGGDETANEEGNVEPSRVLHLTREEIVLIR